MTINITPDRVIKEIQKEFNEEFPFLKIEFCLKKAEEAEHKTKQQFCNPELKLLDLARKPESGWIVLHPWYTIRYIKEVFKTRFGLNTKIFRKENDQYIQILGTDAFTLEEQNEIGRRQIDKNHEVFRRERELLL